MKIIHPNFQDKGKEGRPRCPRCKALYKAGKQCPNCGRKRIMIIKDGPERKP